MVCTSHSWILCALAWPISNISRMRGIRTIEKMRVKQRESKLWGNRLHICVMYHRYMLTGYFVANTLQFLKLPTELSAGDIREEIFDFYRGSKCAELPRE